MDIVIIEGDPNVLPWEKKNARIRLLFEMCKAVNKTLFACGFGMQLLAHFWAVGERKFNVINGEEKGTLLREMSKFNKHQVIEKLQ